MCFCHSRKLLLFISQLICCRVSYAEIAVVVVETVNEIKNTHMYISCCHITNYIKNVLLSASSFFVVSRENFTRHFSPYLVTFVVSTLFQFFFVSLFFVSWIFGMVKILNFFKGFIAQHLHWLIFIASHTFAFPTLNHWSSFSE